MRTFYSAVIIKPLNGSKEGFIVNKFKSLKDARENLQRELEKHTFKQRVTFVEDLNHFREGQKDSIVNYLNDYQTPIDIYTFIDTINNCRVYLFTFVESYEVRKTIYIDNAPDYSETLYFNSLHELKEAVKVFLDGYKEEGYKVDVYIKNGTFYYRVEDPEEESDYLILRLNTEI